MIKIRLYEERDKQDVINLTLNCQNDGTREAISIENQPDLLNIFGNYFATGGAFWVAEDDKIVVGSIGLVNCNNGVGILKKFFVDKNYRALPCHLGRQLYGALLEFANKVQLNTLVLDTPKNTERAHKFYCKAGFIQVEKNQLPVLYDCPYADSECDFFILDLKNYNNKMEFTEIDISLWDRAEYYNHFSKIVPCTYNITANIDITILLEQIKLKQLKLYPALIFMLTKTVNSISAFRLGYNQENTLGIYNICHPSFTIPNAIKDGFSGIWAYSCEKFNKFYNNYCNDVVKFSKCSTYAPKADQPQNTFYVSCTPDISFTALSLTLYGGANCLTPMFTIGKFFELNGAILLPLSTCLHHAACDGAHAAKLYKQMQQLANNAQNWL